MQKQMMSKFSGKCKGCGGRINKGEPIIWSPEFGARHDRDGCDKINGKSRQQLAVEWDNEHQNDMSLCERTDIIIAECHGDISEDDAFAYACQDKPRNPFR